MNCVQLSVSNYLNYNWGTTQRSMINDEMWEAVVLDIGVALFNLSTICHYQHELEPFVRIAVVPICPLRWVSVGHLSEIAIGSLTIFQTACFVHIFNNFLQSCTPLWVYVTNSIPLVPCRSYVFRWSDQPMTNKETAMAGVLVDSEERISALLCQLVQVCPNPVFCSYTSIPDVSLYMTLGGTTPLLPASLYTSVWLWSACPFWLQWISPMRILQQSDTFPFAFSVKIYHL